MPTPNDTSDPIILRLRALAQGSPDLQDAARMYEAILPVLRDADLGVGPISLTPEQARAKMKKGQPLLFDLALDLDVEAMRELMLRLARAVESPLGEKRPQKSEAARLVRCALEENRLNIDALLPHIAAGERGTLTSAAQSLQLDPDLVWSLAQSALKPALRAWRRQLTPLAKGISWHKGCCFVCGAVATLAELQENNQCKHLRCGQCGADWQFPRLQCLYCGNEEHKTQGYLYPETRSEVMRVEVCNKCHCYSKIIAAFTPTPPEMLPVEDLATLHLDYLAQELGYSRRPVL